MLKFPKKKKIDIIYMYINEVINNLVNGTSLYKKKKKIIK